jgi:hypothetical protein
MMKKKKKKKMMMVMMMMMRAKISKIAPKDEDEAETQTNEPSAYRQLRHRSVARGGDFGDFGTA